MADAEEQIAFYSGLYGRYGDSAASLNWGSVQSQYRRFEVLASIAPLDGCSILDIGCGLGDFLGWLRARGISVSYTGIELTPVLARRAAERFPEAVIHKADFGSFPVQPRSVDYVFASGIFYLIKREPERYMRKTIARMYETARAGVAFNSLSTWSRQADPGEFRADPLATTEFCATLTRRVALRHDYHPGDFTIYLYRN